MVSTCAAVRLLQAARWARLLSYMLQILGYFLRDFITQWNTFQCLTVSLALPSITHLSTTLPQNPQLHPRGQWPICHPSKQTEISPHFPHSALSGEAALLLLSARKCCGVSDTTVRITGKMCRSSNDNHCVSHWHNPLSLLQTALPSQKALNYCVGVGESVYTFSWHIWSLLMMPKYWQISNARLPVENTTTISKTHSCKQPWIYKFTYKSFV